MCVQVCVSPCNQMGFKIGKKKAAIWIHSPSSSCLILTTKQLWKIWEEATAPWLVGSLRDLQPRPKSRLCLSTEAGTVMGLCWVPQCSTGWVWGFARKANDDSACAASGYIHKPTGKIPEKCIFRLAKSVRAAARCWMQR